MRVAPFIAFRYLFAKKSHNVINIISAISALGMAIGTAALVIILSIYNGFDTLVRSTMGSVEPDFMISPTEGKTFSPDENICEWIENQEAVKSVCQVLEEEVLISYGQKQALAKAKGVDQNYVKTSPIRITRGDLILQKGDLSYMCLGAGIAKSLDCNSESNIPIEVYFPSRTKRISPTNPAAALNDATAWPSGIFQTNTELDQKLILLPIEVMRELLEYDNEEYCKHVSSIEIRLHEGTSESEAKKLQNSISKRLGENLTVKNRLQQNESLYRMMKYEKMAIYMILCFVIIIIGFNIFGSLSMLMIEKKTDIRTLRYLGTPEKTIRRIFVLEGWMISLVGLLIGLTIGLGFAFLQQQLGFIKMPGQFLVQAYPVIISWTDILYITVGVAGIGYLIALLPVSRLTKN